MFLRTKHAIQTQMQGRARLAFHAAKNKLSDGSPNKSDNPLLRDKHRLMRGITTNVKDMLKAKLLQQPALPPLLLQLCNTLLKGFLAELYQCGNCVEYAALIHTDYLENGVNQNIEILYAYSKNPKVDHGFFVSNRDSKASLQNPKKWRAVSGSLIVNDPWLHQDVKEHTANNMPDKKQIIYNNETATSIGSYALLKKDLDQAEWQLLFGLLNDIKVFLTVNEIEKVIQTFQLPFVAKDEHARIIKQIDEKIAHLKECAQEQRAKMYSPVLQREDYFPAAQPKPTA